MDMYGYVWIIMDIYIYDIYIWHYVTIKIKRSFDAINLISRYKWQTLRCVQVASLRNDAWLRDVEGVLCWNMLKYVEMIHHDEIWWVSIMMSIMMSIVMDGHDLDILDGNTHNWSIAYSPSWSFHRISVMQLQQTNMAFGYFLWNVGLRQCRAEWGNG